MDLQDYARLDAYSLAALIKDRSVNAAELLDCAVACIERTDPSLHAISHRLDNLARERIPALQVDAVLGGVPFLVKDAGSAMVGAPMTYGSRLFAELKSAADNTLVERYRAAGLQIVAKTRMPELGLSFTTEPLAHEPTRNPWNLSRSAGGSSGGSAAAVAAGVVPVAHATDGAGSIRLPASHCGLFGLKPSRMRNPVGPQVGETFAGLSAAHCVSRTVRDSAMLLDATAGAEAGDPYTVMPSKRTYFEETARDPHRLRIGFSTRSPTGSPVDPECAAAAYRAAALCQALGHVVEESELTYDAAAIKRAWRVIAGVTTAQHVRTYRTPACGPSAAELLEPVNAAWVAEGENLSAIDYATSIDEVRRAGRTVGGSFQRFDVFLTPSAAAPAPPIGELACLDADLETFYDRFWDHGPFTAIYNAAGCPAMSVPMGWSASGLPTGAHFGAALGQEGLLFSLAGQIERASPWVFNVPFSLLSRPPRVSP